MPSFDIINATSAKADFEGWALDIYEWLGLVALQSPRVQASDNIDPYLSRYHIPAADNEFPKPCNLVTLSWKALLPASWVRDLFITLKSVDKGFYFVFRKKSH